jgi:uncharacterized protein
VATHKANIYIDLSGWSPKYFPPHRLDPAGQELFGSDWLMITPDCWLSDFAKLEIREEVRPKVLKGECAEAAGDLARSLHEPTGRANARSMINSAMCGKPK